MAKYRISKYAPKYRNRKGEYKKDDWTSYADIGKEFDAEQLTAEKFLDVEKKYCNTVKLVFEDNNVDSVMVKELECNFTIEEIRSLLNSKGIELPDKEIRLLNNLKNDYAISHDNLDEIISLILKDCCWCKLVADDQNFIVEFGFDLYIYITCDKITNQTIQKAELLDIFVERVES